MGHIQYIIKQREAFIREDYRAEEYSPDEKSPRQVFLFQNDFMLYDLRGTFEKRLPLYQWADSPTRMVSRVSNIRLDGVQESVRSIRIISLRAYQFLLSMPVSFFWSLHVAEAMLNSSVSTAGNLHQEGVMAARKKSPKRGFISQRMMTDRLQLQLAQPKQVWESIRESTKDRPNKQNRWRQWYQFLPAQTLTDLFWLNTELIQWHVCFSCSSFNTHLKDLLCKVSSEDFDEGHELKRVNQKVEQVKLWLDLYSKCLG